MSRPDPFDVRVSPAIEDRLRELDHAGSTLPARFVTAVDRLAANGLDGRAARKLTSLDLWEVRVGDHRAFLRLVRGSRMIAVGSFVPKRRSRLNARMLATIERQVQRWVDDLQDGWA
jgi:hypothetical protein